MIHSPTTPIPTLRLTYRTVFISDVHLGATGCHAKELASLLKRIDCETLYLVGDILDMWRLRSRWLWPPDYNKLVKRILQMAQRGVHVVYIPGNHDEHARSYCGLDFGGVRLRLDAHHTTADNRRLLITHGDQADLVVKHARLLSVLGSWAYDLLLKINVWVNRVRRLLGLRYWSLAQYMKHKVKSACTFISRFEDALLDEARRKGFDGVVCGHIHKAEARHADTNPAPGTLPRPAYYNCGDWIESCTILVEHASGSIELLDGLALLESLKRDEAEPDYADDDVPNLFEPSSAPAAFAAV